MSTSLAMISGVRGYVDQEGTAYLNLEDVSRGLGFTQTKGSVEYVRYERVNGYLRDMGFPQLVGKEFIPENVFYRLAMKGETEAAMAFQAKVADEILPAIRKTGTYSKPMSVEDLIIMQAQSMKELRTKVDLVQNQLAVANHRIDSLDTTDIIGDLRQRLNAMVRKYARRKGVAYNVAWSDFTQAFNTAYHTNLELRKTHYQEKHRRQVTTPEFLEIDGRLEDAVRVADKLLNRAG